MPLAKDKAIEIMERIIKGCSQDNRGRISLNEAQLYKAKRMAITECYDNILLNVHMNNGNEASIGAIYWDNVCSEIMNYKPE